MEFKLTTKVKDLPALDRWINPRFHGMGDLIVRLSQGISAHRNDPRNWKEHLPAYNYSWPALLDLKARLNLCKHRLDKYNTDKRSRKEFLIVSSCVRLHEDLRGEHGIVARNYQGEIVTNAWLKMFELCKYLKLPTAKKLFKSFHIAEAPGNFMLAINHYLKTVWDGEWSWHANTYRSSSDDGYLGDNYGIIAAYSERWLWGADGDGDITSPANIASFAEQLNLGVNLITSDVKDCGRPEEETYDEEERVNAAVHIGQTLAVLKLLSKGGTAIIKVFAFFEPHSVALLWILNYCFQETLIVKPTTSKPANSEVYLVLRGYRKNLSQECYNALENWLRFVRDCRPAEAGIPALFLHDDIPVVFVEKIIHIMSELVKSQTDEIGRVIELYEIYKELPYPQIVDNMRHQRKQVADEWLSKTQIKPLPIGKGMLDRNKKR
jgi:hypothetical protein